MALPPGLRGWYEAGQADADIDSKRLSGLAQIQQMAQNNYKMGRLNQYDTEIAQATTPEERYAVASKFMGADALGKSIQDAQNRAASLKATQATNMLRIQNQAQQFDATMQVKWANIQRMDNAEARAVATDAWHKENAQGRLALETAARQEGAARVFYDTGEQITVPGVGGAPAYTPRGMAPAAPVTPPGASSGLETLLAGRPPEEQSAITAAASPRPTNLSVTPQGLIVPQQGDAAYAAPAAPAPAPVAPAAAPAPPPVAPLYRDEGSRTLVPAPAGPVGGSPGEQVATAAPVTARTVPALPRQVTAQDAPAGMTGKAADTWATNFNNTQNRAAFAAANKEGGGILNTNLRMQEGLKREIAPHRKVMDAYERFLELRESGDTSQANLVIAQQIQQMSQTGQRAFTKRELETTLGSGDLGGNWFTRLSNMASQAIAGVRTAEIDQNLNAAADAMAKASADRIGDSVRNARQMVPANMNPDNLVPGPMIMGRFIVSPTGKVYEFASRKEAQARFDAAAKQVK